MMISSTTSTTAGASDTYSVYSYEISDTSYVTGTSDTSYTIDTSVTGYYETPSRKEPEEAQFAPLPIVRNWDRYDYRCPIKMGSPRNLCNLKRKWLFHGGSRVPRYGTRNFKKNA